MPNDRRCIRCGNGYNFKETLAYATWQTDWGLCKFCLEERQKLRGDVPRSLTGRRLTRPAIQDIPRPKIQNTPLPRPTNIQNRKLRLE